MNDVTVLHMLRRAYAAIDTHGDVEVGMLLLRRVLESLQNKKEESKS